MSGRAIAGIPKSRRPEGQATFAARQFLIEGAARRI
jgi:hypothetical protein